jgi:hypothetical protein
MTKDEFLNTIQTSEGCSEWVGGKSSNGYGMVYINGVYLKPHRASYMFTKGPIPEGIDVLHKCDNPGCINPDHLFLGNDCANQRDSYRKGRSGKKTFYEGELWLMHKLRSGKVPYTMIAKIFKANYDRVWKAMHQIDYNARRNPC